MWKLLLGLIYVFNKISDGYCLPRKQILTTSLELDIREKRYSLEYFHYIEYKANEIIYKNWDEVQVNPKHDCERFMQKIFPKKKDLASSIPRIQKVILNYNQISDENNNKFTPKRVTALECRLHIKTWSRRFIYFIRSPQSPNCALFLNRIRRRSSNFYIVEDICEYKKYPHFWKYTKELEEDKPKRISRASEETMMPLLHKELKFQLFKFEERHREYCSSNSEICKLWPELQINPQNECQRFFKRMLTQRQDLSLVTAKIRSVTLHYLEIRDQNNRRLNPVVINSIACRLPQPILGRRYVYFIRAPSYPSCVFFIFRKLLLTEHFHIGEEVCDIPSGNTSLYTILLKHRKGPEFTKRIGQREYELSEKIQKYEEVHFQDYLIKRNEYEEWPELRELNTSSFCQIIIENIFPKIANTYEIHKLAAESEYVELKYATMNGFSNKTITVKALDCLVSERPPPNQFRFIRAPCPNCVYWIRRKYGRQNFYFISREFCKDDVRFSNLHEINLDDDDDISSWINNLAMDDEFLNHLFQDIL